MAADRAAGDRDLADLVQTLDHAARLAGPEIRQHGAFVTDLPPGPILVQGSQARRRDRCCSRYTVGLCTL